MTLTTSDIKKIGVLLDEKLEKKLDEKFDEFKNDILETVDERLTNLKSDFFEKVDPVLKEVTTARDERVLIENRLENLEEIHPKGTHTLQS